MRKMTLSEKILAKASHLPEVEPGQIVQGNIDIAMIHDATGPQAVEAFTQIGVKKVWDPEKVVVLFDHIIPASDQKSAGLHRMLRKFVKEQGITHFFDVKEGVCHQVLPDLGFIRPGEVVVGTDSHTCTYGAFGNFGTGIGSTEMAAVFVEGRLWFKVPETIKVVFKGQLKRAVTSKDMILFLIGKLTAEGANYMSLEFTGPTVEHLSLESRMTLCNMAIECGAKAGLIDPDEKVFQFLKGKTSLGYSILRADPGATYAKEMVIDVSDLEPQVSCPHAVDNVKPISQVKGKRVDQIFLGSCTNARLEDLRGAAEILKGKTIHPDIRMIVIPASATVYREAIKEGIITTLLEAKAIVCNPGCGPCFGGPKGIIAEGEVCLASSNRNFRGRMGKGGEVYLASPLVVSASALKGEISDPREL
jgi:3-isopropylmalate/(R)-2-methylmalate dehydratase large subunit